MGLFIKKFSYYNELYLKKWVNVMEIEELLEKIPEMNEYI